MSLTTTRRTKQKADSLLYYRIWQRISLFCDDRSLMRLGGTCRILKEVVNTDEVWEIRLYHYHRTSSNKNKNAVKKGHEEDPIVNVEKDLSSVTDATLHYFYDLFDIPESERRSPSKKLQQTLRSKKLSPPPCPMFVFRGNVQYAHLVAVTSIHIVRQRTGGDDNTNKFVETLEKVASPSFSQNLSDLWISATALGRRQDPNRSEITALRRTLRDFIWGSQILWDEGRPMDNLTDEERIRKVLVYKVLSHCIDHGSRVSPSQYVIDEYVDGVNGTLRGVVANFRYNGLYLIGFGLFYSFHAYIIPSWRFSQFLLQVCQCFPGFDLVSSEVNKIELSQSTNNDDPFFFDRKNPLPYLGVSLIVHVGLGAYRAQQRTVSSAAASVIAAYRPGIRIARGVMSIVNDVFTTVISQTTFECVCRLWTVFFTFPLLSVFNYFYVAEDLAAASSSSSSSTSLGTAAWWGFNCGFYYPWVKFLFNNRNRGFSFIASFVINFASSLPTYYINSLAIHYLLYSSTSSSIAAKEDGWTVATPMTLSVGLVLAKVGMGLIIKFSKSLI